MNRRDALAGLTQVIGAGIGLGGSSAEAAGARPRRRPAPAQVSYPTIQILTADDRAQDGRPCFSPDGSTVLFMRSVLSRSRPTDPWNVGPSEFWTIPSAGGTAQVLVRDESFQYTRPDWSWERQTFAVAYERMENGRQSVYLLDVGTRQSMLVLRGDTRQNQVYSYPSWYPGGYLLSVTNYWSSQEGDPSTRQSLQLVTLAGESRALTNPRVIWPGMSSVFPGWVHGLDRSPPIAFAGERPNANGYNQDQNQIWIRRSDGSVWAIDGKQARAPWWSPDGRLIAFESNRLTGGNYQIFVQSPWNPGLIRTITPPTMRVQHAKWSPDGSRLVFAYAINEVAQGIAIAYLNT